MVAPINYNHDLSIDVASYANNLFYAYGKHHFACIILVLCILLLQLISVLYHTEDRKRHLKFVSIFQPCRSRLEAKRYCGLFVTI